MIACDYCGKLHFISDLMRPGLLVNYYCVVDDADGRGLERSGAVDGVGLTARRAQTDLRPGSHTRQTQIECDFDFSPHCIF